MRLCLFPDSGAQPRPQGGPHSQTQVRETQGLREAGCGLHQELPQELHALPVQQDDGLLTSVQ